MTLFVCFSSFRHSPFHTFLFYLSVFTTEPRPLHNGSGIFLHFGPRCSSSTSPCGSAAGKHLIRYRSLSSSTHLTFSILVFIARISYKSPLAWACQRQTSAAHFSPLSSCVLLLLPDRLTSRRAASRSSGSCSFSCFLSPILVALTDRLPPRRHRPTLRHRRPLCFAVVDSLHASPSP